MAAVSETVSVARNRIWKITKSLFSLHTPSQLFIIELMLGPTSELLALPAQRIFTASRATKQKKSPPKSYSTYVLGQNLIGRFRAEKKMTE